MRARHMRVQVRRTWTCYVCCNRS